MIGVSGSRCVQAMLNQGTWNYWYLSPNQLIRKLIGCDWVWQYFLWPSLLFYSVPYCVLPSITVNMKYWGRCLFLSRIIYYLVSKYFRIQSYYTLQAGAVPDLNPSFIPFPRSLLVNQSQSKIFSTISQWRSQTDVFAILHPHHILHYADAVRSSFLPSSVPVG